MTPTSHGPADATPEEDFLDQHTPMTADEPDDSDRPPDPEPGLSEADDADLAEQAIPLPDDEDDDYPRADPETSEVPSDE